MNNSFRPVSCSKCGSGTVDMRLSGAQVPEGFDCVVCGAFTPVEQIADQAQTNIVLASYNLSIHGEHAAALGCIVAGWSALEHTFGFTMALLMRAPFWQASAAFHAIPTFNTRIKLIEALTPKMEGATKFSLRLNGLLGRARQLSEVRNNYVHEKWSRGTNADEVFLLKNAGTPRSQHQKIQAKEMQKIAADIMKLNSELNDFANEYSGAYPVPLTYMLREIPTPSRGKSPPTPQNHSGGSDSSHQSTESGPPPPLQSSRD